MQRSENQVTRGRGLQSQLDRFQVAHLTDEDDVGIFTKRASQGGGEGLGVHADFTVIDQRTMTLVDELDRVSTVSMWSFRFLFA